MAPESSQAWTVSENGQRRPLLMQGAGDVNSADLPRAIRSGMRVDALARTVQWSGDRGWIRAAAGERTVVKNGGKLSLPRPVRFLENGVLFPEELIRSFADIFSFVEVASGQEGDVLAVQEPSPATDGPSPSPVDPSAEPSPPGTLAPDPPAPTIRPGMPARAVRTIVIDPGHGGGDPGAKGRAGSVEKDIVLAISLELARAFREADPALKVVLTRSTDDFVTLQERARVANTQKADVFVSVHANSVKRNSDAGGFEVFHLDVDGGNLEARAVAAIENAEADLARDAGTPSPAPDVSRILGDVMQMQYIDASLELSKHIADGVIASVEGATKNRGSKGAFFYVLKDVLAPAVLVEVGFLTNEWEASFLQKPWYQRKIAMGILRGILNFKAAEEARLNPVETPTEITIPPQSKE